MKKLIFLLAIAVMLAPPLWGQGESDTVWTKRIAHSINSVQFHPDGERILVGGGDGDTKFLLLLDTDTGQTIKEYKHYSEEDVCFLAMFSPTGDTVISAYDYNSSNIKILFHDTETGELIEDLVFNIDYFEEIFGMDLTNDGKKLYLSGKNAMLREKLYVYDIQAGTKIKENNSDIEAYFGPIDLSSDGNILLVSRNRWNSFSGKRYGAVELRNAETLEVLQTLGTHDDWIKDLCFSPDGTMIASAGEDGKVKVWNVESGELIHEFESSPFLSCAFSIDSKFLATSDYDNLIIWDMETGLKQYLYPTNRGYRYINTSPDGKYIVTGSGSKVILFHARWEPNSIPEEMGSTEFNVFPNPVERILSINFLIDFPVMTGLEILDVTGALIFEENYGLLVPGEYDKIVNTAGLPVGTYFCRLTIGKASHSVKFIISE